MKVKLAVIFFGLLFIFSACNKGKVGGKCKYVDVDKNVTVSFIDGKLDSVFMISFQPIGVDTDEVYRITNEQFKKANTNFKIEELQNKSNSYTLTIAERTAGSCVPFTIKKITLK